MNCSKNERKKIAAKNLRCLLVPSQFIILPWRYTINFQRTFDTAVAAKRRKKSRTTNHSSDPKVSNSTARPHDKNKSAEHCWLLSCYQHGCGVLNVQIRLKSFYILKTHNSDSSSPVSCVSGMSSTADGEKSSEIYGKAGWHAEKRENNNRKSQSLAIFTRCSSAARTQWHWWGIFEFQIAVRVCFGMGLEHQKEK